MLGTGKLKTLEHTTEQRHKHIHGHPIQNQLRKALELSTNAKRRIPRDNAGTAQKKRFEQRQKTKMKTKKKTVLCGGERKAFCIRAERVGSTGAKEEQRANCLSREWLTSWKLRIWYRREWTVNAQR